MKTRVEHSPAAILVATQLIAACLIAMVVSSTGISVFVYFNRIVELHLESVSVSYWMLLGNIVSLIILAIFNGRKVVGKTREELPAIWQRRMILRFACLEVVALLNAATFIAEHQIWMLALMQVMVVIMIIFFPTKKRFDRFIENNSVVESTT